MKNEKVFEGIFHQSGVIPYRIHPERGLELLLITSRSKQKWIFPKGIVESDLSPWDSAAKEAYEEAGIEGDVHQDVLGEFTYNKWNGTCRVLLYPMHVKNELKRWPEADIRKRQWLSYESAREVVNPKTVRKLLVALPKILNGEIKPL